MRLTVELPEPMYRRLESTAIERGLRDFSPIIEDALTEYLDGDARLGRWRESLAGVRGAWSGVEVEEWEREVGEAWSTWRRIDPAATES